MFLSQRTANAFGYIALVVLLLLFVLDYGLHLLPPYLRLPIFFLALALFMVRVTLRLLLARRGRSEQMTGQGEEQARGENDRGRSV